LVCVLLNPEQEEPTQTVLPVRPKGVEKDPQGDIKNKVKKIE